MAFFVWTTTPAMSMLYQHGWWYLVVKAELGHSPFGMHWLWFKAYAHRLVGLPTDLYANNTLCEALSSLYDMLLFTAVRICRPDTSTLDEVCNLNVRVYMAPEHGI
ncbi:unnamed protein product [Protopolystoma xenopodis]|uniref:Uncharacterized protein n=1 Tax=Protopolystoma xenopodis TaxID=117903 RepID=A0A448WXU4_9PLAT|nr:unnamed protein product [Protopolystoma xenopodis]